MSLIIDKTDEFVKHVSNFFENNREFNWIVPNDILFEILIYIFPYELYKLIILSKQFKFIIENIFQNIEYGNLHKIFIGKTFDETINQLKAEYSLIFGKNLKISIKIEIYVNHYYEFLRLLKEDNFYKTAAFVEVKWINHLRSDYNYKKKMFFMDEFLYFMQTRSYDSNDNKRITYIMKYKLNEEPKLFKIIDHIPFSCKFNEFTSIIICTNFKDNISENCKGFYIIRKKELLIGLAEKKWYQCNALDVIYHKKNLYILYNNGIEKISINNYSKLGFYEFKESIIYGESSRIFGKYYFVVGYNKSAFEIHNLKGNIKKIINYELKFCALLIFYDYLLIQTNFISEDYQMTLKTICFYKNEWKKDQKNIINLSFSLDYGIKYFGKISLISATESNLKFPPPYLKLIIANYNKKIKFRKATELDGIQNIILLNDNIYCQLTPNIIWS
jgi:hypothetical protein